MNLQSEKLATQTMHSYSIHYLYKQNFLDIQITWPKSNKKELKDFWSGVRRMYDSGIRVYKSPKMLIHTKK